PFDAVLLDLALPDSSGIATLLAMRSAAGELPIIVMTADCDESIAIEAMRKGAQDYVIKGELDGRRIARALTYAIERQALQARLKDLERQIVLANRMTAVGTLAAGVGHEINNPLAYVIANIEYAMQDLTALLDTAGGSPELAARLRNLKDVLGE